MENAVQVVLEAKRAENPDYVLLVIGNPNDETEPTITVPVLKTKAHVFGIGVAVEMVLKKKRKARKVKAVTPDPQLDLEDLSDEELRKEVTEGRIRLERGEGGVIKKVRISQKSNKANGSAAQA